MIYKFKNIAVFSFFPFCILILIWLYFNSKYYLGSLNLTDYDIIRLVNSDNMGFSCYITIGTIYTLIFLLYLNFIIPQKNENLFIRMGRKNFVFTCFKQTLFCSLCFSIVFTVINTLCNYIFFSVEILNEFKFIIFSLVYEVLLFYYFLIIGIIFISIYLCVYPKVIALAITSLTSFLMVGLKRVLYLSWLPISDICIIDYWMEGRVNLLTLILNITKNSILITLVVILLINTFQSKDILPQENNIFFKGVLKDVKTRNGKND